MKMGRRILAVLVAVCVAAGVVVWSDEAEEIRAYEVFGDFYYEVLTETTVSILAYMEDDTMLTIPDMIDGKSVTRIGDQAFYGKNNLIEINIPNSVEYIGANAFRSCSSLSRISLPNSLQVIGEGSFRDCRLLKEIDIPSGISSIGEYAFWGCTSLTQVSLPNGLQVIDRGTFFDCSSLMKIDIPSGISSIEVEAFAGCSNLTQIRIPDSINRIGGFAFSGCAQLEEIVIPDGVDSIESRTFDQCHSLTKIHIPDSVDRIGSYAFGWCSSLTQIRIPNGVNSIGECAFVSCDKLEEVYVPNSLKSIESGAFWCNNLKNIYYGGTKKQWDQIIIDPDNNMRLRDAIIHWIDYYKYIRLEDGTLEITEYIGNDTTITIPSQINNRGVTSICFDAFLNNTAITKITIPSSITKLGDLENGTLGCFGTCQNLEAIHVDENNPRFSSEDGVLFDKQKTTLIRHPAKKAGAYTIPSSVESIENDAFEDCIYLTGIKIPGSVTSIGYGAFINCSDLAEITLPPDLDMIDGYTFASCEKLKEIEIPSGVQSIGHFSFGECTGLKSISIPASVTDIEEAAFFECSSLKDVYYSGVKSEWDQIQIDTSPYEDVENANAPLLNAVIHFSDGTTLNGPQETIPEEVTDAKQELEKLKSGDPFSLEQDFGQYMSPEQIDIIESCLFTWLAEINYAYQYSGSSGVKERVMKKAGIDPDGDFASGAEQAVTHISVETAYGPKTFEITLGLGRPDSSGNLYPAFGSMHYEVLEKGNIPSTVPKSGSIGRDSYTDLGTFVKSVKNASEDTLHSIYQWQQLSDEMTAGALVDKTVAEIIGNKNGSFLDGTFTIYAKPLFTYRKIVTITCTVNVNIYVYSMDGTQAGSIVDNQPSLAGQNAEAAKITGGTGSERRQDAGCLGFKQQHIVKADAKGQQQTFSAGVKEQQHTFNADVKEKRDAGRSGSNVQLDVNGSTKTVYLAGDDYYLQMHGTDTGTMSYEVEEVANEDVRRKVQFLELQLQDDMQYDGYVFRPLNIDKDLYALRVQGGSTGQDVVYAGKDSYQPQFKQVEGLSLSQQNTSLDADHTIQLNASLYPLDASNPNLVWKTDNASVVTVDSSGLVTAVGAGRATVMVSTKDGSFLKQYCIIDVAGGTNGSGSTGGGNGSGGTGGSGSTGGGNGTGGTNSSGSTGSGSGTGSGTNGSGGTGSGAGGSGGLGGAGAGTGSATDQEKPPVVVTLHYVLQFDANGGSDLSRRTMTLLADESPGIMPKVRRSNYLFNGWYTKQDGGVQVGGDKPLNEASTLYAHWTKVSAPKAPSLTLKSKKKGQIQAGISKVSGAAGYEIDYSVKKDFSSAKTKKAGAAVKAKTITGLKAGKKYYVRVRAYAVDSMKNRIYGDYSEVKSEKVKKK